MLFVAPDASISMIKENAEPMSEELIISRDPVRAVIEINAGQAKRHGIKVGDKVTHMLLNSIVDVKTPGAEAQTAPQASAPTAQPAPKAKVPVPTLKVEPQAPAPIAPETPAVAAPQAPTAPKIPAAPAAAPKLPIPAPAL